MNKNYLCKDPFKDRLSAIEPESLILPETFVLAWLILCCNSSLPIVLSSLCLISIKSSSLSSSGFTVVNYIRIEKKTRGMRIMKNDNDSDEIEGQNSQPCVKILRNKCREFNVTIIKQPLLLLNITNWIIT